MVYQFRCLIAACVGEHDEAIAAGERAVEPGGQAGKRRLIHLTLAIRLIGLIGVKILAPGFYAQKDIRTPVKIAVVSLVCVQLSNLMLVPLLATGAVSFFAVMLIPDAVRPRYLDDLIGVLAGNHRQSRKSESGSAINRFKGFALYEACPKSVLDNFKSYANRRIVAHINIYYKRFEIRL